MATLLTKKSDTASSVPTAGALTNSTGGAEIAVNTADKRLFTKDSGGSVVELGTNPSSLSLPNGTANGVAYLNGSKVLTSGSALTFDGANLGLGVTPSAWDSNAKAIQIANAGSSLSAGSTSYSGGNHVFLTNNGYQDSVGWKYSRTATASQYYQIGNEHRWLTAPSGTAGNAISFTQAMTLDANGVLLVGATSNTSRASTNSKALFYKSSGDGYVDIQTGTAATGVLMFSDGSTGNYGAMQYAHASDSLAFVTASSERARIDSAGNLGLGVTPSAWTALRAVELLNGVSFATFNTTNAPNGYFLTNAYYDGAWRYKASTSNPALRYEQSSVGAHIWSTAPSGTAGNAISFTQAMTLDASGQLGIGTTSPVYQLDVRGTGISTRGTLNFKRTLDDASIASITWSNGDNGWLFNNANGGYHAWQINGTERARIDASGNLLVGTTNTDPPYSRVNGIALRSAGGIIARYGSGGTNFGISSSSGNLIEWYCDTGSRTQVGTVSTNGSSTSYNTSSDYRLKNTITPMTGALAKVAALKPCTYKWNADGSDGEGFIAHELAEVCPQAVSGEKDAVDADGKPIYQGIDTSFLVATLTAALQEAVAEINSLKARLDAANL